MKWTFAFVVLASLAAVPQAAAQQFTEWSTPVNLGPAVNSPAVDSCVSISKDGLSLFFSSTRQSPGNGWDRDLYVSQRESVNAPWGTPQPLTSLNTVGWESCPALSLDEHRLYFSYMGSRPGCGGTDIWVSRRQDRRDDFGWEPPVNLGCIPDGPNTSDSDVTPGFFEDDTGKVIMYFGVTVGAAMIGNLYQAEMRDDGTFGSSTPVAELNTESSEMGPAVRRDGLEMIFLSDRPGGGGSTAGVLDFWTTTRASTSDPWSAPVFVSALGAPALAMGRISLSFDGRELYFGSMRPGNVGGRAVDLWVATREKVTGKNQ